MSHVPHDIRIDDILIRRVPPTSVAFKTVTPNGTGRDRATSASLSLKDDEQELSCSLLRITSPRQLLDHLTDQRINPTGWNVCAFVVRDVESLGFTVRFTPIEGGDTGHCSISNQNEGGPRFPDSKTRKFALKTIILNEGEIAAPSRIPALFKSLNIE